MNKFKKLASKLIQNKLWCSEIVYVITEKEENGPGLPVTWGEISRKLMNVVIKSVSKNLVDNVNIFNTDSSFVLDAITITPKKEDYIVIKGETYKIVAITPLGTMSNEPTAYEIVMRLA